MQPTATSSHTTTSNDDPLGSQLDGHDRLVTVDAQFCAAMQELQGSSEPGDILAIGGRTIFLTDRERAESRTSQLQPTDFRGDLVAWRHHLRGLLALDDSE